MRTLLRDEAQARAALIEVRSYDVDLDLTAEADFGSEVLIRFSCRTPGASSFVELDGTLLSATLNGRELGTARDGNRITLDDLHPDNELRVVARCQWSHTGEGLHRFTDPADGRVYLWGQSATADAQRMFACFDQPDLKATFGLTVTALPDWVVIANERGSSAGDRWAFAPTQRMSTYLFTVLAGPWHGERRWHDGIELGLWCRQSLAPHLEAEELFEITEQCFDHYTAAFGVRYPFGDTYDQIWAPELNFGAMENPGAVTFSESLLFRSRVTVSERRERSVVIAHEMAHMWFGNLVTMRWWDDLWLNESFADLMGYLTTDEATRFDGVWPAFCLVRKDWGYATDQLPTTHPIVAEVQGSADALSNVDGISYAKGASVLRQLMAVLGPEDFNAGLQIYLRRHAFDNTSLADFLAALEEASGRDLAAWGDAWLRTCGVSTLRVDAAGVHQEPPAAHPVLRAHRIGIGRYDDSSGQLLLRDRLDVELIGASTSVPGLDEAADLILPNDGDLTFAKIRLDSRSLATVTTRLHDLTDPLARALSWAALWDATRDAELPPSTFVDAVVASAAAETDPQVIGSLLARARTAAQLWAADELLQWRLAGLCQEQLSTAAAGSDVQLCWAQGWVSVTGDAAALAALLDGSDRPRDLVMDAELRWHVIRRLSALGALTDDDIAFELAEDDTAAGARHADTARAARPDRAAKERAWQEVTTNRALSNHQSDAVALGFWQPDQVELCRPYMHRYFAEIAGVWSVRSPHVARILATRLFPSVVVEPETLEQLADFLSATSLPPGLRRVVVERGDDLRRAVAARAREAAP
ncbi:MAG: aminopeptidase N [Mycobacteriales bacterium]